MRTASGPNKDRRLSCADRDPGPCPDPPGLLSAFAVSAAPSCGERPRVPHKLRGTTPICVQNRQFRAIAPLVCTKPTVLYANRGSCCRIGRPLGRAAFGPGAFPQLKAQCSAAPHGEALALPGKRRETRTKPLISCRHAYLLHKNDGFVRNGMEGRGSMVRPGVGVE